MGGRTSQLQNGTQTTYLPPEQQINVDMLLKGARDLYGSGGPKYYPGQMVAQATPDQAAARTGSIGYANGVGGQLAGDVVANDRFWLNPQNVFNPSNIPGFQAATEGVTRNVTRNFTESLLPEINGAAITANGLGGSRAGMIGALAAGRSSEALADQLARMNMEAYSQGLNMNNAAANRAPQTFQVGNAPNNLVEGVGAANRADAQANINADVNKWNYEQTMPMEMLQFLQSITGNAGQYGGTVDTKGENALSGGNQTLQGIGSLLSIASLFGKPIADLAGKVIGTGAGAGAAAAGGALAPIGTGAIEAAVAPGAASAGAAIEAAAAGGAGAAAPAAAAAAPAAGFGGTAGAIANVAVPAVALGGLTYGIVKSLVSPGANNTEGTIDTGTGKVTVTAIPGGRGGMLLSQWGVTPEDANAYYAPALEVYAKTGDRDAAKNALPAPVDGKQQALYKYFQTLYTGSDSLFNSIDKALGR